MSSFYRPASIQEAVQILRDNPGALVLAGGTDLVIDRRLSRVNPDAPLVDITAISELQLVRWNEHSLRIGSATSIRAIECDAGIRSKSPALTEAARVLGSVQIRNMATIGGNLCNASPAAEMLPPLLVHDAVASVHGVDGEREFSVGAIATGPRTTSLANDELLLGVRFQVLANSGSCYVRQTVRWAMDLAGVGAAAWVHTDGKGTNATIEKVRVALNAVAPTAILVPGLDHLLLGGRLSSDRLDAVRDAASASCSPISDVRGTAEHRRHVAGVLAARALAIAYARANGTWKGNVALVHGLVRNGATAKPEEDPGSRGTVDPAHKSGDVV